MLSKIFTASRGNKSNFIDRLKRSNDISHDKWSAWTRKEITTMKALWPLLIVDSVDRQEIRRE